MPRHRFVGARRAGFTLIELLVVIAIIAILAAILFPVFAQAKAAAKKATAISNSKQISLGAIMYSGDSDDVVVPYFSGYDQTTGNYTVPQKYWPDLLTPYISKVVGSGNLGQALAGDLPQIFFDPIKPFKSQIGDPNCGYGVVAGWGISDDVVSWWAPPGINGTLVPINYTTAAAPADTLIFAETYDWLCDGTYSGSTLALSYFDRKSGGLNKGASYTLDAPYNATYKKVRVRQDADPAGLNVVGFLDGHAKAMNVGKLTQSGTYWSVGHNNLWP